MRLFPGLLLVCFLFSCGKKKDCISKHQIPSTYDANYIVLKVPVKLGNSNDTISPDGYTQNELKKLIIIAGNIKDTIGNWNYPTGISPGYNFYNFGYKYYVNNNAILIKDDVTQKNYQLNNFTYQYSDNHCDNFYTLTGYSLDGVSHSRNDTIVIRK